MLVAGADGHEETRVAGEGVAHRIREERLQVQRPGHILIACGVAVVAAAEWLHSAGDAAVWAWTAGAAGAGAVAVAVYTLGGRGKRRLRHAPAGAAALPSLALGALLGGGRPRRPPLGGRLPPRPRGPRAP